MPRQPEGEPAPADGSLPAAARATLAQRPFGLYLHVPYCASLCGYCDFNTYISKRDGEGPRGHVDRLLEELRFARGVLADDAPPVETVFVGGGTPSLLGGDELARLLSGAGEIVGIAAGAEVTTEANPESTGPSMFAALREAGYTRISLGMQSATPHVLTTLERSHSPGRAAAAVREARAAGFEHVSLDLIYGTPGESESDWRESLETALSAGPDHISAYALIVEEGTRLHAQVRSGAVPTPDDDVHAARYELADSLLTAAGMSWYEISNWARDPAARCRHNDIYWSGGNWWGAGPGAHSHIGGVRWWNELHPSRWHAALAAGRSPAAGRELPGAEARRLERIMLGVRRREGLELGDDAGLARAARRAADDELLEHGPLATGHAVLTLRGRLLADRVTLDLAAAAEGER